MSINRNKGEDRYNTERMCDESPGDISSAHKNWLDHSGACAKIDSMLLKGASFKKLLTSGRKSSAVRSHLYHLKTEHGLTTENDCIFRLIPDTDSVLFRTPIPLHSGQ